MTYVNLRWPGEFFSEWVSTKVVKENQNTHCMFSNVSSENHAANETMWKDKVEPDRPQITM
jgi:hypothetical protein